MAYDHDAGRETVHSAMPPSVQISRFDEIFIAGPGPSSTHTVGPMRAAMAFAQLAAQRGWPVGLECDLFGSLALSGRSMGTAAAVIAGLSGCKPADTAGGSAEALQERTRVRRSLRLAGAKSVPFDPSTDLRYRQGEFLDGHASALQLRAHYVDGMLERRYVWRKGATFEDVTSLRPEDPAPDLTPVPARKWIDYCRRRGLRLWDLVATSENLSPYRSSTNLTVENARLIILDSIERGARREGVLPGRSSVPHRAQKLHALLLEADQAQGDDIHLWATFWAMAVCEESAQGGVVVAAPTNGVAGVLAAGLKYYETFLRPRDIDGSHRFLLAASAIGAIVSRARLRIQTDTTCHVEIGLACAMTAAGLVGARGGSDAQMLYAAGQGLEGHRYLACETIGAQVTSPCIHRNARAAITAIEIAEKTLRRRNAPTAVFDAAVTIAPTNAHDLVRRSRLGWTVVDIQQC